MTDRPNEEIPVGSTVHDELDLEPPDDYGVETSGVTLTQRMLGLEPYMLIRAVKVNPEDEKDDGLRLNIELGGGATDGTLAALYVLNLPAESNPITAAIKAVIDANGEFPEVAEVLGLFAEFCDVPMPS